MSALEEFLEFFLGYKTKYPYDHLRIFVKAGQ
jgi:hypothetical protein